MYIRYSDQASRKAELAPGDAVAFGLCGNSEIMTGHICRRSAGDVEVAISGDGVKTVCKTLPLQEMTLYRSSETEDPDIEGPLRDVKGEPDEKNGEFNIFAVPNGSNEPLVVAQLALGTGHFIWASKALYEFYGTDEGEKMIEEMVSSCETYPIKLSAHIVGQLRRLSELNFLRGRLIKELTEELDARYDLDMDVNALSPLENFSMDRLLSGEVKNGPHGRFLHCDGHRAARQGRADGLYCWQTVGYCEDDYSGEQFVRVEGNSYLCLPFEF